MKNIYKVSLVNSTNSERIQVYIIAENLSLVIGYIKSKINFMNYSIENTTKLNNSEEVIII